jgi:peptidoglycan/xylan/chitin deacetylase (PgdA/CDA1 family)
MEILRRKCSILPLHDLIYLVQEGKSVPRHGCVVTFDDGYQDNLTNAKPILEHHDVPATVYVATGGIGSQREFWWDDLDRLLLQEGRLPGRFDFQWNGRQFQGDLGSAAVYEGPDYEKNRAWHVLLREDPTPRHALYRTLHNHLRGLSDSDRSQMVQDLAAWSGLPVEGRPSHLLMRPEGIVELTSGGLIDVGAHTVTHSILFSLTPQEQSWEIKESKRRLEEILGKAVPSFAYPFGGQCDYTPETVQIVKEAGYSSACSNFEDHASRFSDPYQLPRYLVRNWDGETFERVLSGWLKG